MERTTKNLTINRKIHNQFKAYTDTNGFTTQWLSDNIISLFLKYDKLFLSAIFHEQEKNNIKTMPDSLNTK